MMNFSDFRKVIDETKWTNPLRGDLGLEILSIRRREFAVDLKSMLRRKALPVVSSPSRLWTTPRVRP